MQPTQQVPNNQSAQTIERGLDAIARALSAAKVSGGFILGRTTVTSTLTFGGSYIDVTSALSVVHDGGFIKVSLSTSDSYSTVAGDRLRVDFLEDGVNKMTRYMKMAAGSTYGGFDFSIIFPSTAGSHTYKAQIVRDVGAGTGTIYGDPTAPITFVVEQLRTANMAISALTTAPTITSPPPWIYPTLQNSWVAYNGGFDVPSYFKDPNGYVHIRGFMKSGSVAVPTLLFTLPVGYRPGSDTYMPAIASPGSALGCVEIKTTGAVNFIAGNNTYFSLGHIIFPAEN